MAQKWDPILGKFVGTGDKEFTSQDYMMFSSLTPEKQAEMGAKGYTFNNEGKLGLAGSNSDSIWTKIKNSFEPQGESGTSYGGNVIDAVGKGVNAATGLAGIGLSYLNAKETKRNNEDLRALRANQASAGKQAAINAGNGASYNYGNIS